MQKIRERATAIESTVSILRVLLLSPSAASKTTGEKLTLRDLKLDTLKIDLGKTISVFLIFQNLQKGKIRLILRIIGPNVSRSQSPFHRLQ